ncbi:peptidoglycan bridge formation glycyltransferase FemA/FemB family protein [Nitrospinae bacterium AH_259_B05_G02_I21]|nr:peptidoglycan bridge formation glycyltransferase FemA/FemB family protein [Nitrospinae bacterium AH_259_B05_G02_I21]
MERLAPGAMEVRGTLPIHGPVVEPAALHPVLERYGFVGREWATVLIDLRVPPEERWKKLTKGSRYDVRKAQRDGIEVSEITSEEELKEYYGVLREAARRNRVPPALFGAVAESWRYVNQRYRNSIFLARHRRHIVAGLQTRTFNGVVGQGSVVTSNYGHQRRLFGMHLLAWHLIEWGHRQGGRYLDLAGVNPDAEGRSSKEAGIYFFKSRWGGELVRYKIYTKPISALRYGIIRRFREWRK